MNITRLLSVASVLLALSVLMILFLVVTEKKRLLNTSEARAGMEVERGALLYELHCRSCHGSRGEGVGQLGPPLSNEHFFKKRLQEVGWQSTLEEYIQSTSEHGRMMGTRPIYAGDGLTAVMPPWHIKYGGPLRGDEIDLLVSFITNWEDTATGRVILDELKIPEIDNSDPRILAAGEKVFNVKCSRCHRYRDLAAETETGPDLSGIARLSVSRRPEMDGGEYIKESILVPGAFIVAGYEKTAAATPCSAILSLSSLESVTAFLLQQ